MYALFLAYRYLRSLWLTYLAVGMVFFGVLAMVVVLSVMWGLEEFTRQGVRGTVSDVLVFRPGGYPIEDYGDLCGRIRTVPDVEAAWPVVEGAGVLRNRGFSRGVKILGIDYADPEASRTAREFVAEHARGAGADAPSWPPPADPPTLWLGRYVEGEAGDEVDLFVAANSPSFAPGPTQPSVSRTSAVVGGHFLSRSFLEDDWGVYAPLASAQRLFRLNHPPTANRIQVRLKPGADDRAAARAVESLLGSGFAARPWTEAARRQVEMLELENRILFIILACLVLLAGFGILAILNMQVSHKLHEIGILKALGGTQAGIASIFLVCSTAIGLAGAGSALAVGWPLLHRLDAVYEALFGGTFYMVEAYGTKGIPVLIRPDAILGIACGAVLVSAAAGVWPAWRAAARRPSETLRNG